MCVSYGLSAVHSVYRTYRKHNIVCALYVYTYVPQCVVLLLKSHLHDMCLGTFCVLGRQIPDEGNLQVNSITTIAILL